MPDHDDEWDPREIEEEDCDDEMGPPWNMDLAYDAP